VFRTINDPLADELVRHFSLSAGSLGIIASAYFLAFALSAIPIGVALDAFGLRLVQGWLMIVAAIGALLFAAATSPLPLFLGRFLIGIGVAGALVERAQEHPDGVRMRPAEVAAPRRSPSDAPSKAALAF